MAKKKGSKSANAGVHATTGFEFQKHNAIQILIDNYDLLKEHKYFICVEHHDDFLFCYLNIKDEITNIETYQSKKSSSDWKISPKLYEIIQKITETGTALEEDSIKKSKDYSHTLNFITNYTIRLDIKEKNKIIASAVINETNNKVKYLDLDKKFQDKISEAVKKLLSDDKHLSQLEYLTLVFVDMQKTAPKQRDSLVGSFSSKFGKKVSDPSAAVDTLLKLFRDIENTYNQGGRVKLLDETKRVTSQQINNAFAIIENEQRALDLWRKKTDIIADLFNIPMNIQPAFELEFVNSFDCFKDLKQSAHQKILKFTKNNKGVLGLHTKDEDCIQALLTKFKAENNTTLTDMNLKAALFAAYIEVKG